jgi:hypothetical protein
MSEEVATIPTGTVHKNLWRRVCRAEAEEHEREMRKPNYNAQ